MRTFEIIREEFMGRLTAVREGKEIDNDMMSSVLGECLDDETMASGNDEEIINKAVLIIYGLIWGVSRCNQLFCPPYKHTLHRHISTQHRLL